MNIRYFLGSILIIPLLPLMYIQGKSIRSKVPTLPEAKGNQGISFGTSEKRLRVLAIGESTIAGVGVKTHQEGFTGSFASELALKLESNIHWKVYAKSGYTAEKVTERIIPKINEIDTDIIVIGLGGNDAFTLNSPKKWRSQIQELIYQLRLKFKNAIIIFANMPPIKEFPAFTPLIKATIGNLVEILGDELDDIVNDQENVYYYSRKITLNNWTKRLNIKAKPSEFFSDGVHPSKLTYQTWAKDMVNFILGEKEIKSSIKHKLS
ncbi:SGNH/GDSL hydrolase family protein [Aquimarina algiphila]|uniref:SGNH/GDSL hydrolase family protein n=1 Tax=Aquimarina algiphila TaxID=2047982 RepID=UPI0024936FFD|nr:SGNH/GDSL hydrolase family protein [Aquimarina algiphila]